MFVGLTYRVLAPKIRRAKVKGRADEDIGPYGKGRNQARGCVGQRRRWFNGLSICVPLMYARARGKRDHGGVKTLEPPLDPLVETPFMPLRFGVQNRF